MKLLLDSHALVWSMEHPEKMPDEAQRQIRNPENAVFFSAASVWELELKSAKGKIQLPDNWVENAIAIGFSELAVSSRSAATSARLPFHHKDPFDRLLIAQALEQGLTLATRDGFAALYGVPILKV